MSTWEPPVELSREELIKVSEQVLARPDIPMKVSEHIFRTRAADLDWDIVCEVFEPEDSSNIPIGADGKKVGMLFLHGGGGDHRSMRPFARLLTSKFGCKVVCMSYPGRCYLENANHDWPGDTINADGTVRTPNWLRGLKITRNQYEVIRDRSDPKILKKRGTVIAAVAKEGTEFFNRMAAWPMAFEVGGIEVCRWHMPEGEYTVYGHGHSTGGPFINMLSQRIPNFGGIGAMENSPFGQIYAAMSGTYWNYPFNYLAMRTWRDTARYRGPENGLEGAMRLPMLMEEILEEWDKIKVLAGFKGEGMISWGNVDTCAAAGRATAKHLRLDDRETEALVKHYRGYTRELAGPGVKPVPPLLLGVAERSVDHSIARYQEVVLPAYAAMNPPPKVRLTAYRAGIHKYMTPEPGLPMGCGSATAKLWMEAIANGYYTT